MERLYHLNKGKFQAAKNIFSFYVGIKSVLVLKCILKSSLRNPGLEAWPCTALQVSAQRNCFWFPMA